MEKVKERITHYSLYVTALLKWLAVGALVGGVGGFVGALFHLGVDCATNVRLAHPWILYLLPLGGVVIALLYRLCRLEGAGTNAVIESVHFGKEVPVLLVPLIFSLHNLYSPAMTRPPAGSRYSTQGWASRTSVA